MRHEYMSAEYVTQESLENFIEIFYKEHKVFPDTVYVSNNTMSLLLRLGLHTYMYPTDDGKLNILTSVGLMPLKVNKHEYRYSYDNFVIILAFEEADRVINETLEAKD